MSTGGARLVGAVEFHVFETIAIDLELSDETITVIAKVVRVDTQQAQAAVELVAVTPANRDAIDRALSTFLATVRQAEVPIVLIYGVDSETADALERDIAQLARRARRVATRAEIEPALAEASAIILGSDATDVLALAAASYPNVRRVVMFGEQLGALDRTASRLVDAVLRTPPRIRPLSRALGIDAADRSSVMKPEDF